MSSERSEAVSRKSGRGRPRSRGKGVSYEAALLFPVDRSLLTASAYCLLLIAHCLRFLEAGIFFDEFFLTITRERYS